MNRVIPHVTRLLSISLALVLIPMFSGVAAAAESDEWQFSAKIYVWLPSLEGETSFQGPDTPDGEVNVERILDSIEGVFMGGVTAQKGRWGVVSDYIYIDLSDTQKNSRELNFGDQDDGIGYKTTLGITGWVWNTVGTYTVVDNSWTTMSVVGGFRYLDLEEELEWELASQMSDTPVNSVSGNIKIKDDYLDAIVGVRGKFKFGQSNWSAPYYLDVGTGDTEYSVQGSAGINYAFDSVDLSLGYRYLEWNFDTDIGLETLTFSGAQFGIAYRW
jgi:hypothetical protein